MGAAWKRSGPSTRRASGVTNGDYRKVDLRLAEREWDCPVCHAHHDRDVNAALNILREGRARSAIKRRAGTARTDRKGQSLRPTPGETRASRAGLRTRKLPALAVE